MICHMITSVDGRIVTSGWPEIGDGRGEYERTAATYGADAWMCGRITMAPFAGSLRAADDAARDGGGARGREDFRAPGIGPTFAVAIDPSGRLAWQTADIDGDHVIAVLTERVSDTYLTMLRARGVSYMFAGARDVDIGVALKKLHATYGVRTVLLEGGGRINGSLLRAGLIDELSILVAPVADGTLEMPSLFDAGAGATRKLALRHVERRVDDVLWLRYDVVP